MAKRRSGKGRSRKSSRVDRWILAGIAIIALAIILVLWGPGRTIRKEEPKKQPAQAQKTEKAEPRQKAPTPAEKPPKPAEPARPAPKVREAATLRIAIVIDDLGGDLKAARELAELPADITFSILPGLPHTREVARLAADRKREVALHMPMERKNNKDKPETPGTLRSDMTPAEFVAAVDRNFESVPGAAVVNNHEGSALTENKEAMKFLMLKLKEREVGFLDSLTSPQSVAAATAREFGLRTARRDVFLDNDSENPAAIRAQLVELEQKAQKRGWAIGIGHPHPATIDELRKWLAEAKKRNIEIVPVSRLMK